MQYLEQLSTQNCCYFDRVKGKEKNCKCLSFLHKNNSAKRAIANYIMDWVALDSNKMILINEIRTVNEMANFKGCAKSRVAMENFYHIFFIATNDNVINNSLSTIRICQHAFAAIFRQGRFAFNTLQSHAKNNTVPVHGNTGRLSLQTRKIKEEVYPRLKLHFENVILPLSAPRPTRFTRCVVMKIKNVRDTNDIIELDPGNRKRRLYGDYAWRNGWKLISSANGSIIKEERRDKNWNGTPSLICSWWSFLDFWKKNYPKVIVRKPSRDICSQCYQFEQAHKSKTNKNSSKNETIIRQSSRIEHDGSDSDTDSDSTDISDSSDGNDDGVENNNIGNEENGSGIGESRGNGGEENDIIDNDDNDDDEDDDYTVGSGSDNGTDVGYNVPRNKLVEDLETLEYTPDEEKFLKASVHVKEAASMRHMADAVIAEAKI